MMAGGRLLFPTILLFIFMFINLPGTSRAGVMITRPGSSNAECAQKCKDEPEIDCRFYKWHRVQLTCFLSAQNDSSITHLRKISKHPPAMAKIKKGTKPASSWINQLQSRVSLLEKKDENIKTLRKELAEMRNEMAALKNSRALTHHLIRTNKEQQDKNMEVINEKTDVIKTEAKRMEDAIMTLGELQKSFGGKMTALSEDRKSTSLSMAMLGQSTKDMKSSMAELTTLTSEADNSISEVRKDMTELEVRFAGLSSDVMEKASNIETMIGPELKELRTTQNNLAKALSLITKKIMALTPKIPEMQHLLSVNDGVVSGVSKRVKAFHKEISELTARVGFAESHLRKFMDPATKMNQDRRMLTNQLRDEVQTLTKSQKRLQNDVLMEISDRTQLYKELADMTLQKKELRADVTSLQEGYDKMTKNMENFILNGPQGQVISKILHRQVEVLKKMKNVKSDQQFLKNDLGNVTKKVGEIGRKANVTDKEKIDRDEKYIDALTKMEMKILALNASVKGIGVTSRVVDSIHHLHDNLTERLRQVDRMQKSLMKTMMKYKTYVNQGFVHPLDPDGPYGTRQQELKRLKERTEVLYDLVKELMKHKRKELKEDEKDKQKEPSALLLAKLGRLLREHRVSLDNESEGNPRNQKENKTRGQKEKKPGGQKDESTRDQNEERPRDQKEEKPRGQKDESTRDQRKKKTRGHRKNKAGDQSEKKGDTDVLVTFQNMGEEDEGDEDDEPETQNHYMMSGGDGQALEQSQQEGELDKQIHRARLTGSLEKLHQILSSLVKEKIERDRQDREKQMEKMLFGDGSEKTEKKGKKGQRNRGTEEQGTRKRKKKKNKEE